MKRFFVLILFIMCLVYCGFFSRYNFLSAEREPPHDVEFSDTYDYFKSLVFGLDSYIDVMTLNISSITEKISNSFSEGIENIKDNIEEEGFWSWFMNLTKLPFI